MNTSTNINHNHATPRLWRQTAGFIGVITLLGLVLGACSSSNSPTTQATTSAETATVDDSAAVEVVSSAAGSSEATATTDAAAGNTAATGGVVLPVPSNPIVSTATAKTLTIESVLVENNVDAANKATSDHLEIALRNTATTDATSVEVFYTLTDPTAGATENYYTKLPADFTVPAGGMRVLHFGDSSQTDHFPVNKFSLYYTSKNALDVSVTVSAKDAAVQTFTVSKDAGGAEAAD